MNSKITNTLKTLKKQKQKAFIPYITAGYPKLKTTENLIHTLERAGATLIELGVPFTDPMADGPTIQKSNEAALKKGITLKKILNLIKKVRKTSQIPILLMGYYNPIYQYGLKKFANDCETAGIDGLLVVDLPPEEATPLKTELKNKPIDLIYLLAPTSDQKRIQLAKKHGSGFIYYVSMTGITGSKTVDAKDVAKNIKHIRKQIKLPINIGFGISKPEHVKKLSPLADGVVVGSSIIKLMEKCKTEKEILSKVKKYTQSMIKAL